MRVQFWGTRGSIAKPGPGTVRYGGNTPCVQVTSAAGTIVVLDCGTGAHDLGQRLVKDRTGPLRGTILISHTHWDHIQGFPFFAPLFVPDSEWDIYAPRALGQSLRETLAGQMHHTYFPIPLERFAATVRYHDIVEGSFNVADIRVTAHHLHHPATTLGYRLEADGVSVVYACDHEQYSRRWAAIPGAMAGEDRRHIEFLSGADLVIHDAQYTTEEYPQKVGWGHSTIDYAIEVSRCAGAKRLALTHHDPMRDDDEIDRIVEKIRSNTKRKDSTMEIFAAADGQVVDLGPAKAGKRSGKTQKR